MSAEAKENTEPDNVNVGLIATITIVGALLVVAIAAALTALVRAEQTRLGNDVGAYADLGAVARLKQEQRATLDAAPAYLDKAKGQIAIPVDRAMQLVTTEIQKDPNAATPAAAEAPAAAPTSDVTPPSDEKKEPSAPEPEKKDDGKSEKGKHGAIDRSNVVEPSKGAPVAPAAAPAPQK